MKLKTMAVLGLTTATIAASGAIFVAVAENNAKKNNGTKISKFENLIDMMGVPVDYNESQYESRIAPFADLGSWHAFALPDYASKAYWGGFTQPLIVRKEYPRSIAKSLDVLTIDEYKLDKKGNVVPHSETRKSFGSLPRNKVHLKQYPGGLWQEFEFDSFTVQLNLRFVQNKTSYVKYNIINHSSDKKAFKLNWKGEMFDGAKNSMKTEMTANSKTTSSDRNFKFNKYGQPLVKKSVLGTTEDGILYATRGTDGVFDGQNRSTKWALAVGSKGHAPDTVNKWYPVGKTMAGILGKSCDYASNITFDAKTNKYKAGSFKQLAIDPSTMFVMSTRDIKEKNTLTINFDRPTSKWSGNMLGHDDEWKWQMKFQDDVPMDISTNGHTYHASTQKPFVVKGKSSNSMFVGTSFTFTAQERLGFQYESHGDNVGEVVKGQKQVAGKALASAKTAEVLFKKSGDRWLRYINNLIGNDKDQNFDYQKVAVKAMETLVNNWRGNAGMLEHQGVTPSISVQWFNEFWSWDTWKQASAEVNFDPKLAIDNVKVMYDYQVTQDPQSKALYNFSKVRQKNDVGMIPDLVAYEQGETNWRDTKPPLSAWSVYNVLHTIRTKLNPNDKDPHTGKTYGELAKEFGKYMYNRIAAYHTWWYSNRDGDHNGINEYGATIFDGKGGWVNNSKDTIITAAAWESGMDNAPRFDRNGSSPSDQHSDKFDDGLEFTVQRNADKTVTGYVLQQESVDLNSYMYAEKGYMIKLADELKKIGIKYSDIAGNDKNSATYKYLVKPGIEDRLKNVHKFKNTANIMKGFGQSFDGDIKAFKNDQKFLGNYINNKMFDKKTGFFYDLKWKLSNDGVSRDTKQDMLLVNRGAGPEGFIPLWANASTHEHAKAARKLIMSPKGFNTYMPFPTAAYNNQKFEPDQYWRGPVWLDQAYFGVQGLERSGFHNNATYMVDKLYRHADGLMDGAPIRENYNPLTGKGLSSKGFSWSSGMYLLMYKNFIKDGK